MSEKLTDVRHGWQGRILAIDLTTGDSDILYLSPKDHQRFLGGVDLAAKLLYERIPSDAEPLGSENVIAVMTGPLTGRLFRCSPQKGGLGWHPDRGRGVDPPLLADRGWTGAVASRPGPLGS